MLILALQLFPTYGGFTRQILFIKPESDSQSGGYFIVIDELAPDSQEYQIDWLLHSRGDLSLVENLQSFCYTVPSYLTNDDISLNVTFLEKINKITNSTGIFCPVNYREGSNYPDVETSYIKASYSGSENPIMATVLYPKNDTDVSQEFPIISKIEDRLTKIGENDYLWYDLKEKEIEISNPDLSFLAKSLFIRENNTNPSFIEYFFSENISNLNFSGKNYLSSIFSLENILVCYSNKSQISGYVQSSSNEISLYSPFTVETLLINSQNITDFSQIGSTVTFSIEEPSSFVLSKSKKWISSEKNPLLEELTPLKMPEKNIWKVDEELFNDIEHPYILFNNTEKLNLRKKINDPLKPWNQWYEQYISGIEGLLNSYPSDYEDDQRYRNVYKLALHFAIENNQTTLDKLKEYLLDIGSITHYSQDLRRAYNVQSYAAAFDIIYPNITVDERNIIASLLEDHARPLMRMDLYHRNNHRVVDAGALGMAGLVLQNTGMINLAIHTILDYYYLVNPADGGSFEGYSYMAFSIIETCQFMLGLKRLSKFNFFEDPKFIRTLDFMADTLGPIGMPGSFEDCTFVSRIQESLLISAAHVFQNYPSKGARYQYSWELRQNNSNYIGTTDYGYLYGGAPDFNRIICYNVNETIPCSPLLDRREIWKESAMAFLRSGEKDGLFMPFSCKNYDQNHPHQDENSFELWAYGAYIVNNPGYPGWGKPFHTWSQSTEGSNTLLIGGSDQLRVFANGLTGSISSPYFSMVTGDANEIYNDLGAIQYSPEFYVLIAINFTMIIFSGVAFLLTGRDLKEIDVNLKWNTKLKQFFLKKTKDHRREEQEIDSKLILLKYALTNPKLVQKHLKKDEENIEESKFLRRSIHLFLSGVVLVIFLISAINVNETVIYHSQYHEDKYNLVFDILEFAIPALVVSFSLLLMLLTYASSKIYYRSTKLLTKIRLGPDADIIKKNDFKNLSSISFVWTFPLIIFSGILIFFTTTQGLNTAIHGLWTELNSISDLYIFVVAVLNSLMRNFMIILIFEIPFLALSLTLLGRGLEFYSNKKIDRRKGWKLGVSGMLFNFMMAIMLFMVFYLFFKSLFSLITIEAIVN